MFVGISIFLLYILNYIVNILFTFYKINCDIMISEFDDGIFIVVLNAGFIKYIYIGSVM